MLYFSSLTFPGTTQLGMQQNSRSIFVNSYLVIITIVTYLFAIFPIYQPSQGSISPIYVYMFIVKLGHVK